MKQMCRCFLCYCGRCRRKNPNAGNHNWGGAILSIDPKEVKICYVGEYVVELIIPDTNRDLKYSLSNNINVYDKKGQLIWNISELLKNYSNGIGIKYYDDMYFDIRLLDNEKIFCIGFINHCEIDLKSSSITKIINNR